MISDKLYELAFEYKKTKLWKILWDTELFAVKLSGGRIGYVCIMGAGGEHLCIDAFLLKKICPAEIKTRDERTYSFFKGLCSRLKVPVSIERDLPALDDAEDEFLEQFGMDSEEEMDAIMNVLDEMLKMDEKMIRALPAELVSQLEFMVEQGVLPEKMEQKLRKVFGFQKDIP